MGKYFKNISPYLVVIAILVILLILCRECQRCSPPPETEIKYDTIYITDTIDHVFVLDSTKTEIEYVYIEKPVPQYVDTAAILKDYFATRYYQDTLINNDTIAFLVINDSISENRVQNRHYYYENRVPKITETIYITKTIYETESCNRFNIGIGGVIGGGFERFSAGLGVSVHSNSRTSYTASYDLINNEAKIGIYYMWK